MGQKINPIGLRLGINRTWDSRWYAGKNEYGKLLHEDVEIREILHKELKQAAVARIVIERPHKKCRVTIHSARPGVVIGKKGADIEKLRKEVAKLTDSDVVINIIEIRKPELDAQLVDIRALLTDHDAGTRRMDVDATLLVRTLDHDLGDRRLLQRAHQQLADRHVFVQQLAVFAFVGEPA